jgi:hypothetical protein
MSDAKWNWDELAALARQAPAGPASVLPPGFADRVASGLLTRRRQRECDRIVWTGALAASVLALLGGVWGWDASIVEAAPPALEELVQVDLIP